MKCLNSSCVLHSTPIILFWSVRLIELYFKISIFIKQTINSWKSAVMHSIWGYLCWLFLSGGILLVFWSFCNFYVPFFPSLHSLPLHCSLARAWNCSLWLIVTHYSNLLVFFGLKVYLMCYYYSCSNSILVSICMVKDR